MRVSSIASGSSGNAVVIEHAGQALLVDCGCSPRRLTQLLREARTPVASLSAVLLTHEHSDHIAGINVVPRALDVPFIMTPGTYAAQPRLAGAPIFAGRQIVEQPVGTTRSVGTFEVTSFPVSHDGAEVCGYLIEAGGCGVAVFTDLGAAEPHLHEPLSQANLVVIEANHDEDMLWHGSYPWHLKRRVASPLGHLSNDACAALLCQVLPASGREIWLAHLSRTNNRPQIAASAVKNLLHINGQAGHAVHVLPQYGATVCWEPQPLQLALSL